MEIEWAHCEQGWWAGLSCTCSRLGLVPKALPRSGRFCLLLFGLRLEQGALYTPDAGCTLEYLTLHFRAEPLAEVPGNFPGEAAGAECMHRALPRAQKDEFR